jgi:hypothetical protein
MANKRAQKKTKEANQRTEACIELIGKVGFIAHLAVMCFGLENSRVSTREIQKQL